MRESARCAAWIVAVHALFGVLFLAPGYIRPDSVATYAYIRSMVFDHDLSFFNEWSMAGLVRGGVTLFSEVTAVGTLANHWWIGTSILASPFYVVLHALVPAGDGFLGPYASLLSWISVAFTAVAMIVACALLPETPPAHRAVALVATMLGTPLFWYTFRFPLGTHAAGAFCVGLIFAALFLLPKSDVGNGVAAGLATGLAIATRLQHFVLLPAVIVVGLRQRRAPRWWAGAILGGALPLAAQGLAWQTIYGTPFGPLTHGANLTGVTWMPFQHIALIPVLFSSYHGLLFWSPVIVLAFAGWGWAWKRHRDLALACILMFVSEWIANGTLDRYFWGGMSFGGRRFVDLAVPFALGMTWFVMFAGVRRAAIIAGPLVVWSLGLMFAAHANVIPLARYVGGATLVAAVLTPETWSRAIASPLHTGSSLLALLIVTILSAAMLALRGHAAAMGTAICGLFLVATALAATKTHEHAATTAASSGIDVQRSRRVGPLLDERRLLLDEIDWARSCGEERRAAATSIEVAAIDRLLAELER